MTFRDTDPCENRRAFFLHINLFTSDILCPIFFEVSISHMGVSGGIDRIAIIVVYIYT